MTSLSLLLSVTPPDSAVVGIADVIVRTNRLVNQLGRESRTRPAAAARAYLEVATELASLWPLYLDAMVTADVSKAESLAARGQVILDGSSSELDRLRTVMRAIDGFSNLEDQSGLLSRIFGALAVLYPDVDFNALVTIGRRQASDALLQQVGPGSAVDFLTIDLVARAYLDPQQLRAKMTELSVLVGNSDRVRELATISSSRADLGVARRDLFESLVQFEKLASSESDRAVILRRLSKTVAELYEAALPFFIWCRLILTPIEQGATYERLVAKDATEHVAWLVKRLPVTFSDASAFLRHAANHGRALDIGPDGASVTVRLRSFNASFTAAEYVDRAFALLESLLAVSWIIGDALEIEGFEAPLPPGAAQYIGLSADAFAEFWLSKVRGVDVRASQRDGRGWRLELGVGDEEVVTIALALATTGEPSFDWLAISTPRQAEVAAELSIEDYLGYVNRSAAGGAETVLAALELRHQVRVGDGCLVSEQDVEFVTVCLGLAILGGDLSQVRLLREARQHAARHGFGDLVALANQVFAAVRTGAAWDVEVALSARTTSFVPVSLPVLSAVTVFVRDIPERPRRSCD